MAKEMPSLLRSRSEVPLLNLYTGDSNGNGLTTLEESPRSSPREEESMGLEFDASKSKASVPLYPRSSTIPTATDITVTTALSNPSSSPFPRVAAVSTTTDASGLPPRRRRLENPRLRQSLQQRNALVRARSATAYEMDKELAGHRNPVAGQSRLAGSSSTAASQSLRSETGTDPPSLTDAIPSTRADRATDVGPSEAAPKGNFGSGPLAYPNRDPMTNVAQSGLQRHMRTTSMSQFDLEGRKERERMEGEGGGLKGAVTSRFASKEAGDGSPHNMPSCLACRNESLYGTAGDEQHSSWCKTTKFSDSVESLAQIDSARSRILDAARELYAVQLQVDSVQSHPKEESKHQNPKAVVNRLRRWLSGTPKDEE